MPLAAALDDEKEYREKKAAEKAKRDAKAGKG